MTTLTAQLKEAGKDLHDRAESAGFTKELFKGRRPIDHYAALLEQMLCVHGALERALDAHADHASLRAVVDDSQAKTPLLRDDLSALDRDAGSAEPLPETAAFVADIERADDPLWLLGVHYVLEGSTNGNRFVARAIRKAYGLEGTVGTRYLDPYGEAQRDRWAAFKSALDDLELTDAERETIVEADLATFRAIIAIHEDLDRTLAAGVAAD